MYRIATFAIGAGLLTLAASRAWAEPVALVIDISGPVTPEIAAFDEIESGSEISLGAGAEIILAHYASCEEVTISGGIVGVGDTALALNGAEVTDRIKTDCPQTVALAQADSASATAIFRGTTLIEVARIPLTPEIVIVGGGASAFTDMHLIRGKKVIATLAVVGRKVTWPEEGLYLSDQTKYVLRLTGPGGTYGTEVVADKAERARVVLRP